METNFFAQLSNLNLTGDLQLYISKGAENNLVVRLILQNDGCGDKAKNLIPSLNLRGTAEELDNNFFQQITTPLETASELMVNMEAFMKQLETAKRQSAMEKEKTDKEKKEADSKEKKYKDAMDKVSELEKEGKHREAWMKVPEISCYPEKEAEIHKRRVELSGKFSQPDLFGATEPEKPEPVQEQKNPADISIDQNEEYEDEKESEEETDEASQDY